MSDVDPQPEPELERWLSEAREVEGERADPEALDGMLESVEREIARAEKKPSFWLRTRPTWIRRAIASGAALAVVGLTGALMLREDFHDYPMSYMALALGSLGALLLLSVHQALRPLHRPPLQGARKVGVVAVTLGATLALALFSPHEAGEAHGVLDHVSGCLFFGLLLGVPVYFVLRLLDRGAQATSLLAACAAGLLGNLVLQLHCPRKDPEHLMLAHFSVVLLFVAGLGGAHYLVRRFSRRSVDD
ncbi:MAG: hypothetical protein SangKO_028350 [Sandaracinaceae bacterium]